MRTTLTLDDDVAVRIERLRKDRGASLKEIVNDLLRRGLQDLAAPAEPRKRYEVAPLDVGKCLLPNLDKISEVLAYAEGEDYR